MKLDNEFLTGRSERLAAYGSMPAEMYTESGSFQSELASTYSQNWISIGLASRMPGPGDIRPVTLAGIPLLITRDNNGRIHVFHNVCRHRGFQLVGEPCQRRTGLITCPYHSWSFTLAGEFKAAPYWDRTAGSAPAQTTRERPGLIRVRSTVWCDIIFVNLSGDAQPFDEFIAPLETRWSSFDFSLLRLARATDYTPAANWKFVCENFLDGYHVPFVHGQVGGPETAINFEVTQLDDNIFGFRLPRDGADKAKTDRPLPGFPDLPEEFEHAQDLVCLFPNTLLLLTASWFQVISVLPLNAASCNETLGIYLVGDEALDPANQSIRDEFVAKLNEVNQQDMKILSQLQAGRQSDAADRCFLNSYWDETGRIFQERVIREFMS